MQSSTALSLVRSGVSLQLIGLIWGMIVQATPYPRLALTAHIQFMIEGVMILLVGILLSQTSLIEIGAIQSRIVYWGFAGVWVVMAAECANAFWGAKEILPIVSIVMICAE
jgi:(hydroxyamino)benzene mutase